MKLSKKLKTKIKKRILQVLTCVALITTTLAGLKLADFSMPFSTELSSISEEDKAKSGTVTRLANTDTTTYIYDAADLVAFRDAVNAGNIYSGKTVYLMADIDLSSVCSSTLGSWVPIGATGKYFAGTFDGNYHTISNLYISGTSYRFQGLFMYNSGVIQNTILQGVNIYNAYSSVNVTTSTGGIVAYNSGTIKNCGINSGSISNIQNVSHTTHNNGYAGGITGYTGTNSKILNCYNKATIKSTVKTTNTYQQASSGGIVGHNKGGQIENCYNTGAITGTGYNLYVGGIIGRAEIVSSGYVKNSYNIGTISATGTSKEIGGIIGRNGYDSSNKGIGVTNCYCTTSTTYLYDGYTSSTSNRVAAATLKTYTVTLGSAFAYDVYNQNSGYPVLAWQNETTVMKLNKNQEYIKVGENLQLNIVEDDAVTEKIGNNYQATNFTWTSTNEDVATVDENGIVTGISDGYTTVYAYHQTSGLYAMCIINVAKEFTNPQIETGNRFTTILKSDGTVWTIGNNSSGQLGNGTTENTKIPVNVHVDEDTVLDNIQ